MIALPNSAWIRFRNVSRECFPVAYNSNAYRDYLRRKFNNHFHRLTTATSAEEVAEILRGSRSKDRVIRYLRENTDKVLHWLECEIAGNTQMDDEPHL